MKILWEDTNKGSTLRLHEKSYYQDSLLTPRKVCAKRIEEQKTSLEIKIEAQGDSKDTEIVVFSSIGVCQSLQTLSAIGKIVKGN